MTFVINPFWRRALVAGALATGALASAYPQFAAASVTDSGSADPRFAVSQPGNYLAGLIASADRDSAAAEAFYREALRLDPRNAELIERSFSAALSNGDIPEASALAERLLARDPNNRLARLALSVSLMERGDWAAARAQLQTKEARDVTSALLTAWTYAGQNDLRHALETLDRIRDPAVVAFRDFHAGLIAAELGNPAEAQKRLKSAYQFRQERAAFCGRLR